ncbi:hypothetical protein ZWY2020_042811 [Hordeum vulgare]|nr:hypothetical protein ZWY2020_042811 [Hordeum vulgare]
MHIGLADSTHHKKRQYALAVDALPFWCLARAGIGRVPEKVPPPVLVVTLLNYCSWSGPVRYTSLPLRRYQPNAGSSRLLSWSGTLYFCCS